MPILPTSRTVPQSKDIAVVSALPLRVGSSARQDLDSVLVAVDTAIDSEANARITGDNTNATNLANHISSATAHPATNLTATVNERGTSVGAALRPVDSYQAFDSNAATYYGQRFTALLSEALTSVRFDLRKVGSPTGTLVAKLYAHSGGLPTGAALATSATVNVANIRSEPGYLTEFTFASPYTLTASTDYIIVLDAVGITLGNTVNQIRVGTDSAAEYGKFAVKTINSGSSFTVQTYALFFEANGAVGTKVQDYLDDILQEYRAADTAEAAQRHREDTALNARVDVEIAQLRATASNPNDKIVSIASSIVSRIDGAQIRLPNGSLLSDFTGATINFATAATTGNVGSFSLINFAGQASKFAKYSLVLLATQPDSILVVPGISFYASLAAAQADTSDPAVSGGIPIAIITVQDDGSAGTGTIQNITQANIQQVKASGSGSGGSGSGSPLDPDQESNYLFYARSDFAVDAKLFYGSISGSAIDQVLGLGRVKFTGAGGQFVSSNLVGNEQRTEANIINRVTGKFRYDPSYKDSNPTIEFSRDGGANWFTATKTNPASQAELWLADYTWATQDTRSSGTANASVTTDRMLALIITPDYDQVITSFDFLVGSASVSGTVTGYIKGVTTGMPNGTIYATSSVVRNLGSDVNGTRQLLNFPITPVTLMAGTSYAITLEASVGATINTESTSSSAAWATSGATNNGSGWVANANKYKANLYSAGTDLRCRVTSSAPSSEFRLKGFGVDFVLAGPATLSGVTGYERRTITPTEAATGVLNFTNITYTPGARQLIAKASGHTFMGPEDFVENSPTGITFTPGFFSAGQVVDFYVAFGLVDGSSQALSKINAEFDAIVGSAAQAAAGVATHSSINSAIAAVPAQGRILLLNGTFTENVTVNKEVTIEGKGRGSVISGTMTFTSASDYSVCEKFRVTGNVTFNAGADGIFFRRIYMPVSASLTDSGTANSKLVIVE